MKRLILCLLFCMISSLAFADVTGEIKGYSQSSNGNIIIEIEYTLPDGKKVSNPYQAKYENFIGKTNLEIEEFISNQIQYQCDNYLRAETNLQQNVNQNIITNKLNSLVGTKYTKSTLTYKITNKGRIITSYFDEGLLLDGESVIKEIELNEDGTYSENITP